MKHTHQCDGFEVRYTVDDDGLRMAFEIVRDADIADAADEPLLHGNVTHTGCFNVTMGESLPQHFCSLEETRCLGRAFASVYALAADKIPKWDRRNGLDGAG